MVKSPYLIFITQLNRFVSQKYWKAKLIALLFIYSLFFATPPLHYLTTAFKGENWQAFNFKTENLTGQPPYGPASHAAKKTFRIFVPIIAKIFHLNNWAVFTLQYIVGLILLLLVINLALLITESNLIASLVTIGFCSIYAGRAAFTDINTWFDEFAFLLLVVPLCFRKPVLAFCCIIAACFTDERSFIASGLLFVFYYVQSNYDKKINNSKLLYSISLAVIASLGIRFFMQKYFGISTPNNGAAFDVIFKDVDFIGMAFFTGLEGFWLIIFLAAYYLLATKKYLSFSIWALVTLVQIFVSLMVFDKTRSMSYLFPSIFIGIYILKQEIDFISLKKYITVATFISILFPAYYIISDTVPYTLWFKPIGLRILEKIILN